MLIHQLLAAYSSGLLAAVSPCVVVLIPLCLIRFIRANSSATVSGPASSWSFFHPYPLWLQLLHFLLGFQVSYLLFGFLLSEFLTSRFQTGFKLALGGIFVICSVLSAAGRIDPMKVPVVKSPLATGCMFALLLSFNPCTVPFLALMLSASQAAGSSSWQMMLTLMSFGQGMLTPALAAVVMGSRLMERLEESAFKLERIKPFAHFMLAASGLYLLMTEVHAMTSVDSIVAAAGVVVAALLMQKASEIGKEEAAFVARHATPYEHGNCGHSQFPLPYSSSPRSLSPAPKARRIWYVLVLSSLLLCTFLPLASLLATHDLDTHQAVMSAFNDHSTTTSSSPSQSQPLSEQQQPLAHDDVTIGVAALANAGVSNAQMENRHALSDQDSVSGSVSVSVSDSGTVGKLHHLQRQLRSLNSVEASPSSSSSHGDHLPSDHSHLDQHRLEVPSLRQDDDGERSSENEHDEAGVEVMVDEHGHEQAKLPIRTVNGDSQDMAALAASLSLSQEELQSLLALEAEQRASGDVDGDNNCIDMSHIPHCTLCTHILWAYRCCVLLMTIAAIIQTRYDQQLIDAILNAAVSMPILNTLIRHSKQRK